MSAALRPMLAGEFDAWRAHQRERYVASLVESGRVAREVAERKAEHDHATLLGDGLATTGHSLYVVDDETGRRVGWLWLGEMERWGERIAFVFDVEIDSGQRGKGHGRRAMELAEAEARSRGFARIELNVFGRNEVARSLYRSLGYDEIAVTMGKDLA